MKNVGIRIKELRTVKGWTQQQLADYAGVKYETLRKAENGTRNPKKEFIDLISKALGISPVALMYGNKNDPTPESELYAVFEGADNSYTDRFDRLANWLRDDATEAQRTIIVSTAEQFGFV